MTPRPFLLITAAAISTAGFAQTPHLQPSAPRTLVITDAAPPPVVRVGLLQSTLFELPTGEKVVTVFGGDTNSWIFDAGHVASRYVSVKPKIADETTDVHIVSDHGNEYTVELREISSDKNDPHFDSKINIASSDAKAADNIAKAPVFVPAAEAEAKEAQLKKEADDAKKAAEADHKTVAAATENFKATYPATLHFDYTWDQRKGAALGIQQIWRDDKFTYLRGQFQETPALYEVKDKKPSLINFDYNNGLYTVPKELESGYLAIGKQKVEFHRAGERN
jgi:type IV secretory pathway VirB9-like protein